MDKKYQVKIEPCATKLGYNVFIYKEVGENIILLNPYSGEELEYNDYTDLEGEEDFIFYAESGELLKALAEALAESNFVSEKLSELKDKVLIKTEEKEEAREGLLNSKEKHLEDMRELVFKNNE